MAEKNSTLILKVDFNCSKCYNKVRRTLCQFHYEIRSQTMDRKANTITITGPFDQESFAKKLKSKAGNAIKGFDIKKKEEEKPKDPPKKADDKPKQADPKPADKPKQADPKPADKPKQADPKPADKPKQADPKPADKPKEDKPKKVDFEEPKAAAPKAAPAAAPAPGPEMKFIEPGTVLAYPIIQPYGAYSVPCYEGYMDGGPLYDGYGRPIGYNNGYGDNRVYGNGTASASGYNNNHHYGSDYFTEKDPTCSIM